MGSYLSKNAPRGAHKLYEKQCQFPGCEEMFMGVGASRYCAEHQKPEYKKQMLQMKEKEAEKDYIENDKSNIVIEHDNDKSTEIKMICPCGAEYRVNLYPNVSIYPRYCMKHRNVFRRQQLEDALSRK